MSSEPPPLPRPTTAHANKYSAIAEELRRRVLDGTYTSKLPGYEALIAEFDTSPITLRKALRSLEDSGLIQGRGNRGIFVTRLRRPVTGRIGVLVPGLAGPLSSRFANATLSAASAAGYGVQVESHDENHRNTLRAIIELYGRSQVDGLLVLWAGLDGSSWDVARYVANEHVPCVLIDEADPTLFPACHHLRSQSRMRDLVLHLASLGHRSVAYADAERYSKRSQMRARYQDYLTGMAEAGLAVPDPILVPWTGTMASAQVERLRQVGAVVASTDTVAGKLAKACLSAGIRIPDELVVTGYDATWLSEALGFTTVDAGLAELGTVAVEVLVDELSGRSSTPVMREIPSRIIIRDTRPGRRPAAE